MNKISNILKSLYKIEWLNLNILECGACNEGDETKEFENSNNCWYIEPNPNDYNKLKNIRKNCLNLALSDIDGIIKFTISSHPGNSSCEYSKEHLDELKKYNSSFNQINVNSISYTSLLKKLGITFDVLVLDVEGHEKTILNSFFDVDRKFLPKILVIECGYDWEERLIILKKLGYRIDCYYFNNCYLSDNSIQIDNDFAKKFNNEWKKFVWNEKTIYINEKSN